MLGWELPPHNSGGLGVACYHLCKALARPDLSIEFILPYMATSQPEFMRITAARPIGINEFNLAGNAYESINYVLPDSTPDQHDIYTQAKLYEEAVVDLAQEKEFDLVHAHDWLTFRAAVRVRENRGCPVILHVHSVESDRAGGNSGNALVREIEETSLQLADRVIAVSEHTKKAIMRDYGVPSSKIEVVHNSIDMGNISLPESANCFKYLEVMKSQGFQVVVSIGRLTVQKGLPNLLRAAAKVLEKQPKTIFLIVGRGEQYHELLTMAAAMGIGRNVIFTSFLNGKQLHDAYVIGDLFVMPSISEPFGLTSLEAAGYGTPSLISRQSGVSEVLHSCLKVDFWDIDEMTNQIVSVLRSKPLRQELVMNAQRELKAMSWEKTSRQIHNIYAQHQQAVSQVAA